MFRYIIRRLGYGFLVMLGVLTVVFLLFHVLPGDPARMMVGQRADEVSLQAIRSDLGLDHSLGHQYLSFINDLSPVSVYSKDSTSQWSPDKACLDGAFTVYSNSSSVWVLKKPWLRRSYQNKQKVSGIISEAFPKTALLAVVAIMLAMVLGTVMGVLSAVYKDTWIDKLSLLLSVFGMSLPSFFAAILMAWLFAYLLGDITGLNMVGSMYTVDDFGRGEVLNLKNLILPAITLGIRPLAIVVELTRSSMLDVLSQDYIRTARAKGLSEPRVIVRHALRNALNPVVTAVSGWFASLLAGAVFVEYVFDWKGLGVVLINALQKYDFPVVMGTVLFISIILVVINIFVDILYGILDPRIRVE